MANIEFIAPNGLIVGGNGHIRIASGNTAQRPATANTGSLRYNTDTDQFEGYYANGSFASVTPPTTIANGVFTVNLTVGNSTVNVFANSTTLTVGNSTVNVFANSTTLNVGTASVNGTSIKVGANAVLNSTSLSLGNSTVSVVANSSAVVVNGTTINSTYVGVNGGVYMNGTTFTGTSLQANNSAYLGGVAAAQYAYANQIPASITPGGANTQVQFNNSGAFSGSAGLTFNFNSNTVTVGNSTVLATVNSTTLAVGNSTVNAAVNSVMVTLANSTVSANLSVSGFATGNTVANTSQVSADKFSGVGVQASGSQYWANTPGIVMTTDKTVGAGVFQAVADAAPIAWSMASGINFAHAFSSNNLARVLSNPTTIIEGRTCLMKLKQPAGGNCTLSFGNCFVFDSDTVPVIGTANNKTSILSLTAVSSSNVLVTVIARNVTL